MEVCDARGRKGARDLIVSSIAENNRKDITLNTEISLTDHTELYSTEPYSTKQFLEGWLSLATPNTQLEAESYSKPFRVKIETLRAIRGGAIVELELGGLTVIVRGRSLRTLRKKIRNFPTTPKLVYPTSIGTPEHSTHPIQVEFNFSWADALNRKA